MLIFASVQSLSWLTVKRLMAAALDTWWKMHFLCTYTLTNCSTANLSILSLPVCVSLDLKELGLGVTSFTLCPPWVCGVVSPLKLPTRIQLAMWIIMTWLKRVYSHHISKCYGWHCSMVICKVGWDCQFHKKQRWFIFIIQNLQKPEWKCWWKCCCQATEPSVPAAVWTAVQASMNCSIPAGTPWHVRDRGSLGGAWKGTGDHISGNEKVHF